MCKADFCFFLQVAHLFSCAARIFASPLADIFGFLATVIGTTFRFFVFAIRARAATDSFLGQPVPTKKSVLIEGVELAAPSLR